MIKKGFQRFKIDGKIYKSDDLPELDKKFKHNIDVVVDRIEIRKDIKNQLTDSIETALNISNGVIYTENFNSKKINTILAISSLDKNVKNYSKSSIKLKLYDQNKIILNKKIEYNNGRTIT